MSFKDSGITSSRFDITATTPNYAARASQIGPCLLISREAGAGGGEIARRAAELLGWRLMDKSILDQLSSKYGTPRAVLEIVDERKVTWLTDIFNGWIEGHGFSQLSYVNRLRELFEAAVKRGNVVIVGRGARFLLPRSSSFSVRIVAPLQQRVERVISSMKWSERVARSYIASIDNERRSFLERYFHQDVTNSNVHDLVINTEQLGIEGATEMLVVAFRMWLSNRDCGGHADSRGAAHHCERTAF